MKIGICYFSGTGNTKWIASKLEEVFTIQGNDVTCYSIEENPSVENLDLLIVGGPIYAGNVPEKLIRWILRNIPDTIEGKAIVYTTSVALKKANGTTSIGKKLQRKGYQVIGQFKYQLPRNFYFTNYKPTEESSILGLFKNAELKVINDIKNLHMLSDSQINEKTIGMDLAAEMMSVMTRFMGKNFSINDDCISCGLCEKNCPTQNIYLEKDKPFKLNCMMCTRCIHNCPVNAISYKGKHYPQYQIKDNMN